MIITFHYHPDVLRRARELHRRLGSWQAVREHLGPYDPDNRPGPRSTDQTPGP